MKSGQSIESNKRNIFLQKSCKFFFPIFLTTNLLEWTTRKEMQNVNEGMNEE